MAKFGKRSRASRSSPPRTIPARDSVATAAKAEFAVFLANNPASTIESFRLPEGGYQALIKKPWGDASLALWIREDSKELAEALNELVLPERLTAMWHKDSRKLEVIWTAQKMPEVWANLSSRKFEFKFKGKVHACSIGASSDRLLKIANNYVVQSESITNYRNLQSYWSFNRLDKKHHSIMGLAETPQSFWISNVTWDESDTVTLVQHINFYMTYYDRRGPFILVHMPPAEAKVAERTRFPLGEFPKTISATQLDSSLLSFWSAGYVGNPMMAFLLYYRILEYAAFNYIDFEIRANIRKLLAAPHIADINIDETVGRMLDIASVKTIDDIPKLKRLIRMNVDPKLLWRDIQANKDAFTEEAIFDGGFSIKALISKSDNEKSFCERSLDSFSDHIRILRNTIAHGKQQETAGVIEASERNMRLLRPWVHLLATAAGEVILYKDVL